MTKYQECIVENSRRTTAIAVFVSELIAKNEFPGFVFVREKRHAELIALELGAHLSCEVPAVTASISQSRRDKMLARMRSKDKGLPCVVSTSVWATGVDVPCLEWVLVAGQGRAPIGFRQMCGRATRNSPGKTGYTLYDWMDTGGNMDGYASQNSARLQCYKRSGFNIASEPKTDMRSGNPAVDRFEELLAHKDCATGPTGIPGDTSEGRPLTSGQQLAEAMCQTPEGFLLLLCFYALAGLFGFITILALFKLLIYGPA
jgi:superfamily II DNA or RNA helicase